jgi:hypothetical protein
MRFLPFALLLISTLCYGQPKQLQKIASKISTERLKKNLYYLASDQLEGRDMDSKGDSLASEYVIQYFKENTLFK